MTAPMTREELDEPNHDGIDFALEQLCTFLGVDPHMVSWDAATETVDGDVQAVIGNIMSAKYGEDFDPKVGAGVTQSSAPAMTAPSRLVTTTFDEVDCKHAADCGWPECDCPRKPKVHSGEAVNYAFNKARELLSAAGFVETAAILDDCRLRPAVADVPLRRGMI